MGPGLAAPQSPARGRSESADPRPGAARPDVVQRRLEKLFFCPLFIYTAALLHSVLQLSYFTKLQPILLR